VAKRSVFSFSTTPAAARSFSLSRRASFSDSRQRWRSSSSMRLRSVHPGVAVGDVIARTGFALSVPQQVPQTRVPGEEELRLIREVLDPRSRRDAEVSPDE